MQLQGRANMKLVLCFIIVHVFHFAALVENVEKRDLLSCNRYRLPIGLSETIPTVLVDNGLTTFATLMEKTGLMDLISGPGQFTVFAPTNDAFDLLDTFMLKAMLTFDVILRRTLSYHVVPFILPPISLVNKMIIRTLGKEFIRINIYDVGNIEIVTINGALQLKIVEATNGIVYVIDRVLLLGKVDSFTEVLRSKGTFSIFLTAMRATQLSELLEGGTPITLFAPTDDAFRTLSPHVKASITGNLHSLKEFLLHHVTVQTTYSRGLASGEMNLVRGGSIKIAVSENEINVSDAKIVEADLGATNGVIHVIDRTFA